MFASPCRWPTDQTRHLARRSLPITGLVRLEPRRVSVWAEPPFLSALRAEGKSPLLYRRRSRQRALFFQSQWSPSLAPGSRWRLMGRIPSNMFVPSIETAQKMKNPSDSKRSFLREEVTADGQRDGGGGETPPTCSIPLGGNVGGRGRAVEFTGSVKAADGTWKRNFIKSKETEPLFPLRVDGTEPWQRSANDAVFLLWSLQQSGANRQHRQTLELANLCHR